MLLKFLEKIGRKYAYVDFYGDVLFYRYYVFFYEDLTDNRFIAKLPNVYVHIYNTDKENNGPNVVEAVHNHPWSTLAFLIKGSYTEDVDGSFQRTTKKFEFAPLSYKQKHRLIKVEHGTISIFMHWFRKDFWKVHFKKCDNICENCQQTNNGKCEKNRSVYMDDLIKDINKNASDGRSWRTYAIIKVDDKFDNIIKRRKKSLEKMGIKIPETLKEKSQMIKITQKEKTNENE